MFFSLKIGDAGGAGVADPCDLFADTKGLSALLISFARLAWKLWLRLLEYLLGRIHDSDCSSFDVSAIFFKGSMA
ncbi:hypothetical protein [Pasteuria penetrans]|uniref:hypothetical protein n=1 Tax=Pasteuria penetrans TaxID=86005 RepID=UPI000FB7DCDC|nr:hypothetical protein [Pasteuria penetrans]